MELVTRRLILRPFDSVIINAAKSRNPSLLGYKSSSVWPEDDLFEVISYFENLVNENGVDGFNSWVILEGNEIIGSAGFTSKPDNNGSIEIGFSMLPIKRKMGYCNEAITVLIEWAFLQIQVNKIIAHCEISNVASKAILQKKGFSQTDISEDLISWERIKL